MEIKIVERTSNHVPTMLGFTPERTIEIYNESNRIFREANDWISAIEQCAKFANTLEEAMYLIMNVTYNVGR